MLTNEQYEFLSELRTLGKNNMENDAGLNIGKKECVDLNQMRLLLTKHQGMNPSHPFPFPFPNSNNQNKDDDVDDPFPIFKRQFDDAKNDTVIEYLKECCLSDFIKVDNFTFGITTKGISAISDYEQNQNQLEMQSRELDALEKASSATQNIAFSIKNQNAMQKNLLLDINSSLVSIANSETIQKDSLAELTNQIADLKILAETGAKDKTELYEAENWATKRSLFFKILFWIIFVLLTIPAIVVGALVFSKQDMDENAAILQFLIVVIPLGFDILLSLCMSVFVKDKEYYVVKYFEKKKHENKALN